MKRKLLVIGVILAVCIAIPLTALATLPHIEFNKHITYRNKTLNFDKVEAYNINDAFSIKNESVMIDDRVRYTDEENNTYVFSDGEIIAYWGANLGDDRSSPENGHQIDKDECLAGVDNELSQVIRGYKDFRVINFDEFDDGYRLLMHNTISRYVQDTLTVQVGRDGSIEWFVADYSNLTSITDVQLKAANESFEEYVKEFTSKSRDSTLFEYELKFREREGDIIATYMIVFKDSDGFFFCDTASFII